MSLTFRPAIPDDAADIAQLINIAAEGMPAAFWTDMGVIGQDPLEIGRDRCRQTDTVFSWLRATMAIMDGEVVGFSLNHLTADVPQNMDEGIHPMFRPLMRLATGDQALKSVHAIAVYPKFRRKGVGREIVRHLESQSQMVGLITTNANSNGQAFCKAISYGIVDKAPVIKGNWETSADTWVLLQKSHS